MKDLKGQFKDIPIARLISWLKNTQRTGVLVLTHGMQRKEIRFRKGDAFAFRSNYEKEQLEFILAKQGVSDLETLRKMRQACRPEKQSFSKKIVQTGILSKKELTVWLHQSLLLAVNNASRWSVGSFQFRTLSDEQIGRSFIVPPGSGPESAEAPSIKAMLAEEAIFEEVQRKILNNEIDLPPMPGSMVKIRDCLSNPEWENRDLLKIILADQLLTTNILKVANSGFYGLSSRVSSLQHAIVVLGIKTIWGIVTHQSLMSVFPEQKKDVEAVLKHSFQCALIARRIAVDCRLDEEEAFTCGLLHDIGKVVLFNLLSKMKYSKSLVSSIVSRFHCETGQLIAAKWNLPDVVLDSIEHHHRPNMAETHQDIIEVVYISNHIVWGSRPDYELISCVDVEKINFDKIEEIKNDMHE